jgi:hypothetical protein
MDGRDLADDSRHRSDHAKRQGDCCDSGTHCHGRFHEVNVPLISFEINSRDSCYLDRERLSIRGPCRPAQPPIYDISTFGSPIETPDRSSLY